MSVKSKPFYWLECDECAHSSQDDGDYSAWAHESTAIDEANDSGWLIEDGRHLCESCVFELRCPECGEMRPAVGAPCPDDACGSAAVEAEEAR
jgi:hypothetical protein